MPDRKIRLQSSEFIDTPGMLRFARNAFRSPTKKDREVAIHMLVEGYGLPRFVAWGLLDGCIVYRHGDNDSVEFEIDTAPRVEGKPECPPDYDDEALGDLLARWDDGQHVFVAGHFADAPASVLARFMRDLVNYEHGAALAGRMSAERPGDVFIGLLEKLEADGA